MTIPVTVIRGGAVRAAGHRDGQALCYDWGFTLDGVAHEQRSYVLLDIGWQIDQPAVFPPRQRGWWYCDLVAVQDDSGGTVRVDDLWIDVIVGPPDHPYRVLDLDEYAAAVANGELDGPAALDGRDLRLAALPFAPRWEEGQF